MTRLLLALATLLAAVAILATPARAAVVVCDGGTCNGTDKPDQITGSPLPDDITAKGGNDEITDPGSGSSGYVGGPNDIIRGNSGSDSITDNLDAYDGDRVYGNGGPDTINVDDPGNHVLVDVSGIKVPAEDVVDCGDGTDTVYADADDIVSNCEHVIRDTG